MPGFTGALVCLVLMGCSLFYTRPVQQMSDTQAAIKAAQEVQADTLAPDLYRQANEWFFKARNAYKLKNFKLATEDATKARKLAEKAEFDAIRAGANREDISASPPPEPTAKASPYAYPTPTPRMASDPQTESQPTTTNSPSSH